MDKGIMIGLLSVLIGLVIYLIYDYNQWRKKRPLLKKEVEAKATIRVKRGQAEIWKELNPVLEDGELGWDRTNNLLKIGDGETSWNDLPYLSFYNKIKRNGNTRSKSRGKATGRKEG